MIPEIKVTIITVVWNNEKQISDAISSVLSQSYPHIEYIVIDGASTDGTLDVIRSFGNRIHKVISEPDKGIYDAMNKGVRLATGDVIGFLNADDFYAHEKAVEQIASRFTEEVDAVYADLDYISLENKQKVLRHWVSGTYSKKSFYTGWMPPHPTFYARRTVYEKLGGYRTDMRSAADYELMLRFLLKHGIKAVYIPQVLVKMRVGGESNRSLRNRIRANREDRRAWKLLGLKPRFYTLWLKPILKISQFFSK